MKTLALVSLGAVLGAIGVLYAIARSMGTAKTPPNQDALDYMPEDHTLVVTERLGPHEYGVAAIVARDVTSWFGLWAEATWRTPTEEEALPPFDPHVWNQAWR